MYNIQIESALISRGNIALVTSGIIIRFAVEEQKSLFN